MPEMVRFPACQSVILSCCDNKEPLPQNGSFRSAIRSGYHIPNRLHRLPVLSSPLQEPFRIPAVYCKGRPVQSSGFPAYHDFPHFPAEKAGSVLQGRKTLLSLTGDIHQPLPPDPSNKPNTFRNGPVPFQPHGKNNPATFESLRCLPNPHTSEYTRQPVKALLPCRPSVQ